MTTYPTLIDAQAAVAAGKNPSAARAIIEIEHAANGRCFIIARAGIHALRAALRQQPIAEIKALRAEHPLQPATLAAERDALARACDASGAFPGSRAWLAASAAEKELAAFDAAHPEVAAAQRAAADAAVAARRTLAPEAM